MFDLIGAGLAGLGTLASGIGNAISGRDEARAAKQNLRLQKQNLAWQKEAQATTWAREDNAVQRRAADMKAAGINPLLAAGSPAQSSSPVRTEAPQMDVRAAGGAARGAAEAGASVSDTAMRAMQMRADFAQKDAAVQNMQVQNDLIRAQAEKTRVEANAISTNLPLDAQRKQMENEFAQLANPQRLRQMAFDLDHMNPQRLQELKEQILSHGQSRKYSEEAIKNLGQSRATSRVAELEGHARILWHNYEATVRGVLDRLKVSAQNQALILGSLKNELADRQNKINELTMPADIAGPYMDLMGNMKDLITPKQWQRK